MKKLNKQLAIGNCLLRIANWQLSIAHCLLPIACLLLGCFLFSGCGGGDKKIDKENAMNSDFEIFKNNFIEELWKLDPLRASTQGYHKYDSALVVPDRAYFQKQSAFAN